MRDKTFIVDIECSLDAEYFADWQDLSPDLQAWWDQEGEQPNCEASGVIGAHCHDCPFCQRFEMDEE